MDKKKIAVIALIIGIILLIIGIIFVFSSKKYTVYFDSKCDLSIESQTVKKGDRAKEPAEPTKEGYIFLGWYIDGNNEKFDFNTKITSDLLLIAKWKETELDKIVEIGIEAEKTEITVGDEIELKLKVVPEEINVANLEITWTSNDENIATVDKNGKVTAITAGKVTVTAKVGEFTAEYEITIAEKAENETIAETEKTTSNKKNTNKNTNTNTNKNTNTNTNTNTDKNTNTNTDTKPEPTPAPTPTPKPEPTPTPKPEITYTYEWKKIDSSVAGEYYLYIVSSEGKHVSGSATIKTKAGKTQTISIPTNGVKYVKDAIASVSNVKVN